MDDAIRREIERIISGNVRFGEVLADYTSIGVGGPADAMVFPCKIEEMGRLVPFLAEQGVPFFPAGNWTNLVVRDGGYRGVVISLKNLRDIRYLGKSESQTDIYAQAGASLAQLVAMSVEDSLSGLEFCAGIPGSVGGAVKMNAGAYGSEMKDVIHSVTMMDRSGRVEEYARERLAFYYRHLDIPEGDIIAAATFLLSAGDGMEIKGRIREIMEKRKGKHPLEYKSAGSIFKNPPGQPAGKIIEEIGLKGLTVGGAMVSVKHGNFIVNTGSATAKDITTLIGKIQETVQAKKGIRLEPEVVIVGEEA
ncbi:MAG: UDP-N-acetylmuramate dehydrogenase [Syntrophales bacterium]|nr:UDP-N-acetylmuramate dehydrogenase [Syntrophales bacterium]